MLDKGEIMSIRTQQLESLVDQLMKGIESIEKETENIKIIKTCNYLQGLAQGHCAYGVKESLNNSLIDLANQGVNKGEK